MYFLTVTVNPTHHLNSVFYQRFHCQSGYGCLYEIPNYYPLFPENSTKICLIPHEDLLAKMTQKLIQIAYFLHWHKEKCLILGHT